MKKSIKTSIYPLVTLLLLMALLSGCAPKATEPAPEAAATQAVAATEAPASEATPVPAEPTQVPTEPAGPVPGGTLVLQIPNDPVTLDSVLSNSNMVIQYMGAALVALSPDGQITPWLAESWEVSPDGLIWTFHLRQDVKFSDGTPLTANDFAFTYNRAISPDITAGAIATLLGPVVSIEAPDDYTLVMTYEAPYSTLLYNLSTAGFMQPISQAAFERLGDDYGRNPVSVGPFKFKEWVTGEYVAFERNPDYNWNPEFLHQGPAYLDEVKFVVIPEYSTFLAGLEAGDIQGIWQVQTQDIQRLQDLGEYQIFQTTQFGIWPGIFMNTTMVPFDNLKVRQAFSYALNREAIRDVVYSGYGQVVSGPLSPGNSGYWPGIEEIGYTYDLDKATQLMEEAGFTKNSDGIWEKDGQTLEIQLLVATLDESWTKIAEVVQSQWSAFGIDCQIQLTDPGVFYDTWWGTGAAIGMMGVDWEESGEFLNIVFSSQKWNIAFVSDAPLDTMLQNIGTEMDAAARQELINQTAQYIMENAYAINMVAPPKFYVFSNQLGGILMNPSFSPYLTEIYYK
jgi:peptide/nickel transport system substrate-binding protein